MYDFYFGTKNEILSNEVSFLLGIKKMLPRWINSIPDTEFITICTILDNFGKSLANQKKKFVVVETGAGASSFAFIYYAIKYNGFAYSWDMNAEKGSLIRTIASETIGLGLNININSFWKNIAYNSLSDHLGLTILKDLEPHISVFMHDSEHVLNTVLGEVKIICPLFQDEGIIMVDDSHYSFIHTDEAYINILRNKISLPSINPLNNNQCNPFYIEIKEFLTNTFNKVKDLSINYKELLNKQDQSIHTYGQILSSNKDSKVQHNRFAAYQVTV